MFKIGYPKSFLKLLLLGFALVMLPLLVAFVNANLSYGRLTKQSLFNMSQAVETTRTSRILAEELAIMERSARQYFVLNDRLLLTNYNNAHKRFGEALSALQTQPMAKPLMADLGLFALQEKRLFNTVSNATEGFDYEQTLTESFNDLNQQSNKLINENNLLIDKESALFKANVRKTRQLLFWQSLTLIPLAIIIAGLITWMIARPIRRMDEAINQLGAGNYVQNIQINGPGDLRKLGARLEWLRVALKDLHQQKQFFLQQASHELKTPLTAIREASELLHDGVAGQLNAQQTGVISILRDNSMRLQKMIENLLKYNEIQLAETAKAPQKSIEKMPLKKMVNTILDAYKLSVINKKITVNVVSEEILIQKNTEKLRSILDNLISNAIKFTPESGEINIIASQTKSTMTIEVIDSGAGIAPEHQYALFEPFFRANQQPAGLVSGSGLGLFIAKEAANALNGELSVAPKDPNNTGGAHFVLIIPTSNLIA